MYVTRTISSFLRNPEAFSELPPGGPWSGIAVILDKDTLDLNPDSCIGINSFPIPQNALIGTSESVYDGGDSPSYYYDCFLMIPVVNEPLSSNVYYAVRTYGKYAGLVNTWSSAEDSETRQVTCCFIPCGRYKYHDQPKPFDPTNKGQHVEILKADKPEKCSFSASFLVCDESGNRPRTIGSVREYTASPKSWSYKLNEVDGQGLNESLRNSLPDFGFAIGTKSSDHVIVGRWYVPFIFVKEFGLRYKEQMKYSMYYKMSLEQRWERVFEAENVSGDLLAVEVDVMVKTEDVMLLNGSVAVRGGGRLVDGVVRFDSAHPGFRSIGLSFAVVERMKWEQARAGWTDVGGEELRLERVEEHVGGCGWRRFGCYVLVERFALKRLDGSLALSYDFYHIHQVRTKWE